MNKLNVISNNAAILSIASIVAAFIGLTRQVYIGSLLPPIEFGIYNFLFILLAYANFADFGINNGVFFESSRAKGSGVLNLSKTMIESGFSMTFFLGLILATFIFSSTFLYIDFFQEHKIILRLTSLVVISTMILNYYQIELRVNDKFSLLSVSTVLSPICSLILSILFGEIYGKNNTEWMLLGWILGPFSTVIFLSMCLNLKPRFHINFNMIAKFIKVGIPLTLLPLALTTFLGIDRWVLVNIADPVLLGFYALGCTFGMALYMIPNALGVVLFSSFLQDSGSIKRSEKINDSLSILITTLMGSSYIMAVMLGAVLIILPFLLNYLFPEYAAGLEVISTVVIAYVILSLMPPLASYLTAYDEKLKLVSIFLVGVFLSGISSFLGYKYFGILGVSYFLILTFSFIVALTLFLVATKNKANGAWKFSRLASLFFPFMVTLTLVYFIKPYIIILNIYDDTILLITLLLLFGFISSAIFIIHAYLGGLFFSNKKPWSKNT
jgi:O-antigen/teichoic acid export membrane protein